LLEKIKTGEDYRTLCGIWAFGLGGW